jgi:hypothetical protein
MFFGSSSKKIMSSKGTPLLEWIARRCLVLSPLYLPRLELSEGNSQSRLARRHQDRIFSIKPKALHFGQVTFY